MPKAVRHLYPSDEMGPKLHVTQNNEHYIL